MSEQAKGICEACKRFTPRGYLFSVVKVTTTDLAPFSRNVIGRKAYQAIACSIDCMAKVEK